MICVNVYYFIMNVFLYNQDSFIYRIFVPLYLDLSHSH